MKKLVLIDGNALIFRAYFATAMRMSRASNGTPTNALYLFATIILKLLEEHDFDDIIVALDSPGKKFRHKEFASYKANRKEVPTELKAQFDPIKEFLNVCNIQTIEIPGYEADDIIGTIAMHAKEYDLMVEVYTGDRDLLQLINPNAVINMMHKGLSDTEAFDAAHLKEVYNIVPRQIIDIKSLMGDASDNIPGVKGVGEKTAFDLVFKYESLDNIYANIDSITGKLKEKLVADKEMAYLSYELATIETNVTLDYSIVKQTYNGYNKNSLYDFLMKYNIKSLLKYGEESIAKKMDVEVKIVEKVSVSLLKDSSFIFINMDNENYHYGNIKGIAISNGKESEYITSDFLAFDLDFQDYLSDDTFTKDCYDLKMSKIALKKIGVNFNPIGFDMLLASYLIKQDMKNINDLFNLYGINIDLISKKSTLEEEAKYAGSFAKVCFDLKMEVLKQIDAIENRDLLEKIEQPLAHILAKMESNGVLVDTVLLKQLSEEYSYVLSKIEKEIIELVGHEVNINSPKQLAELLFDELQLPGNKKRSTSADDLKSLVSYHPVVSKILDYRKYSKLLNTYIDAFDAYKFGDDRIHAMFNQSSTMTGRLSSSQPNLQNLSVRDEERMIIRKLIIAPKGFKILSLDYSQIELRILALLSEDETMLQAFASDYDIHTATASKIYGVTLESVTSQQRRVAKAINFGIVYGISSWGLSEQIGTSMQEAKQIIEKFFQTYPKVKEFLDHNIEMCNKNGYVTTMFNRRRVVNEIHSSNYNIKEFGKRVAMNTPIQGSAADLIKLAMIKVDDAIEKYHQDCRMVCQIHDELLFEVKEEIAEEVKDVVKEIMEHVVDNDKISFKVSYAIGNNWLEAK